MLIKRETHVLLAVHITNRMEEVPSVQKTLTDFGDVIKTRLGLHDTGEGYSSAEGILVLEIRGEPGAKRLQKALTDIKGVETKLVVFKH
jgi:hypothetical protein